VTATGELARKDGRIVLPVIDRDGNLGVVSLTSSGQLSHPSLPGGVRILRGAEDAPLLNYWWRTRALQGNRQWLIGSATSDTLYLAGTSEPADPTGDVFVMKVRHSAL
jgi:hypothetical protein